MFCACDGSDRRSIGAVPAAPDPEDLDPGRALDRGKLKLERRQGEAIVIGDVRVTVAEISPGNVRLFIEAPKGSRIRRDPR